LKQTIKNTLKIFGICLLIAMGIYLVQTIGYSFEKYVLESKNGWVSQFLAGMFGIVGWAFIIFLIVMFSPTFRRFFLKWFNVDSETENSEEEKKEEEKQEVNESEKLKKEFQNRAI